MAHQSDPLIYTKRGRPACVVLVDGHWCSGEVRARRLAPEGWMAEVAYYTDARTAFLHEFPAADVRTLNDARDEDWEEPPVHGR